MLGEDKEHKLQALFAALPEPALRKIYQAFTLGAQADPDALPYERLIWLVSDAARARDIDLLSVETPPEPDLQPEDGSVSDDEALELVSEEEFEDAEAPEGDNRPPEENLPLETPAFVVPRNAMHAFFAAFESLIIDRPKYLSRIDGYICSTSLPAIWRLLNEEESGQSIRDAWVRAELQSEEQPPEFYLEISRQMHEAARGVFDEIATQSRENPAFRRTLISRLGGSHILGDFLELQNLLPLAEPLRDAFQEMAPRLKRYYPQDITEMAELIVAASEISPAMPGYLQLASVATLDEPARALRLYQKIRATAKEGGIKSSDTSLIADHLIAIVDAQALWLERKLTAGGLEEMLIDALAGFAQLVRELKTEAAALEETLLEQRLAPADRKGGQLFAYMIKQSLAAMSAALPYEAGPSGGSLPDTGWSEREGGGQQQIDDAELAALFLTRSFETAQTFGKLVLLKRARKRASEEVRGYAEALVAFISENSGEARLKALRLSSHVFLLCDLLLKKEEADGYRKAADNAARAA